MLDTHPAVPDANHGAGIFILHLSQKWLKHVGKYSSTMEHLGVFLGCLKRCFAVICCVFVGCLSLQSSSHEFLSGSLMLR